MRFARMYQEVKLIHSRYGFVEQVVRVVSRGCSSTTTVSLFAASGSHCGFFVRDLRTNELILPVRVGSGITLCVENNTALMAAFPTRLGNSAGEWLNIFPECTITDPAAMPPAVGMLEARPNFTVRVDGLCLPGELKAPFVAQAEGVYCSGGCYDHIEVCYRLPSGLDVGQGHHDEPTSYVYDQVAHSFGVIKLMSRGLMQSLLAADGAGQLDPTDDRAWTPWGLEKRGLDGLMTTIELDPVVA